MLKRSLIIPILIVGAAIVLLVALRSEWTPWHENAQVQETDDATVRADQVPLSTRISGTVRKLLVGDYQSVTAGQLLVQLDDADYQASVDQAQAALDEARAEYVANQDAKRAADASIAAAYQAVSGAQASKDAAQAVIVATQADVTHSQTEYQRQQSLLEGKATTRQQFENSEAARDRLAADMQARQADLARSETSVASAQAALTSAQQQRAALNAKDALLQAQIEARKAAITIAEVNLGYTKIYAPSAGSVGEFRVHPGQLVAPGIQAVDFVPGEVWIQANFRETQLGRIRPGDTADVTVDALPGRTFQGHVAEISPVSGSQFALLPPDNATGNYTKIVQRVPLRIELKQDDSTRLLRPGFSVIVKVHTASPETQHAEAR